MKLDGIVLKINTHQQQQQQQQFTKHSETLYMMAGQQGYEKHL